MSIEKLEDIGKIANRVFDGPKIQDVIGFEDDDNYKLYLVIDDVDITGKWVVSIKNFTRSIISLFGYRKFIMIYLVDEFDKQDISI